MKNSSRIMVTMAAAAMTLAVTVPAGAVTQEVTASIGSFVSVATAPSASVGFGGLAPGTHTSGGGSMQVSANVAYTVTVAADRAAMTVWDGTDYGDAQLAAPLTVIPTIASGIPVVAPVVVGTSPQTLFTGTGLTSDTVSLSLEQVIGVSDVAGNYRTVLTYTAAETL